MSDDASKFFLGVLRIILTFPYLTYMLDLNHICGVWGFGIMFCTLFCIHVFILSFLKDDILSAKFSPFSAGHHSRSRLQSWNIQSLEALSLMMHPRRKLWLIDSLCGRRRRVMHWRPSDRVHHWEELGLHLLNNQVHTCRWHCNILRNSIFYIPRALHTKNSSVLIFGQFCWLRWLI